MMDKVLIKKLTEAFGPSGREDEIRALIEKEVKPYADEMTVDTLGNLIAHKKGGGKKLLLSTHMDTPGFVVTEVDEKGYLMLQNVGCVTPGQPVESWSSSKATDALTPAFVPAQTIRFQNGAKAVTYYGDAKALDKISMFDMFADLGVSGRDAARELADIGDMAVLHAPAVELKNKLAGAYVSDRVGCAILIDVLKNAKTDCDLYVLFAAQGCVGSRGAGAAAFAIDPDYAVNVHAGIASDAPNARQGCLKLGAGPAVEALDRTAIVPFAVREKLKAAAESVNVPVQNDALRPAGSETAPIQRTKKGVLTGVVSIPTRYHGARTEMIDLSDAENAVKLLTAFINKDF